MEKRQKENVGGSNCKENPDHRLNVTPVPRTHGRHNLHRTRVSINHPVLFTVHAGSMHTGVLYLSSSPGVDKKEGR
jgi:hypothetical protein